MKRAIIVAAVVSIAVAIVYLWPSRTRSEVAQSDKPMCIGGQCCCARGVEAASAQDSDRLTLDPNQFVGEVKQAYVFAGENPALLAQLWCYCGCDKTDGHKSLLDCYRGTHGATCNICTGEALLAKRMSEQGSPVEQIRAAIRDKYGSQQ
jgi:hypothetical protein